MDFAAGSLIAQRYRLIEELGKGGMGCVWRAEDTSLRKRVALKLMLAPERPAAGDGASEGFERAIDEANARFEREARAVAELETKHIAQVFHYGVDGTQPFIVMELLDGETLAERLERKPRIAPAELMSILIQVSRGLGKAHSKGIVHRDLKPANVFLTRDPDTGEQLVKIIDFGIAKAHAGGDTARSARTRTGFQPGTPLYMSPEQLRGSERIDLRTDIWAIGLIAFEALVGEHPFSRLPAEQLGLAICSDPLPVPSALEQGLPSGFDEWFAQAANRDPNQRFRSVEAAVAALRHVCGATSVPELEPQAPTEPPATELVPVGNVGHTQASGSPIPTLSSASHHAADPSCTVTVEFRPGATDSGLAMPQPDAVEMGARSRMPLAARISRPAWGAIGLGGIVLAALSAFSLGNPAQSPPPLPKPLDVPGAPSAPVAQGSTRATSAPPPVEPPHEPKTPSTSDAGGAIAPEGPDGGKSQPGKIRRAAQPLSAAEQRRLAAIEAALLDTGAGEAGRTTQGPANPNGRQRPTPDLPSSRGDR